jgi:hypothetical protein
MRGLNALLTVLGASLAALVLREGGGTATLAIWFCSGNGHVDAEAIAFIAVALLARAARRDGWAGVLGWRRA